MPVTKKRKLIDCKKLVFTDNQLIQLVTRVRVVQLLEIGWKQKDVANTLGVTTRTVINIKNKCFFDDIELFF